MGRDVAARTDAAAEFADWVGEHLPFLSAVATQEVGRTDAEDVVQEALVRAWRRRATFDEARGSTRSWLAAIVLDQSRRHRTRRRRIVLTEVDAHGPSGADVDLQRAVRALPRRQREVVVLHYLADLGVREVAAVLSISKGTVKSTLSDARRALRTVLEES